MLPAIDPEGGLVLALVRGLSVAAVLSVFGTLVFRTAVMVRVFPGMAGGTADVVKAGLVRLAWLGIGVNLAATLAWLVLQSADMAGATSVGQALSAVRVVLSGTWFGHLVALQIVFVVAVALVIGRRDRPGRQRAGCVLCGLATALQAGHGHAAAMASGSGLLLASEVVHLLAAGAWLGGLAPLLLVVAAASPRDGAMAARWFTPLGKLCLVAVVATALAQGWVLVASLPGLVGTGYGWMVLVKTALFGVLFAFAWANRYRFAPALMRGDGVAARRVLLRSLGVQAGFGVAVVLAAAVLGSLAPAMHVPAVWPFAERPSLAAVREDAELRHEVLAAALALGGAAVLAAGAVLVRGRLRWAALAAAGGIAWLAVPHLDLLLVPAYPTSFQRSPTGFSAQAIVAGAGLYPGQCAGCHGAEGHGDGPAASGLGVPPADLTAAHLWMHEDGEMFWWLAHGIEAPGGGVAMPGFSQVLSAEQVWALIDYVRAHNAGLVVHEAGVWSPPVQAPDFALRCQDAGVRTLADLRGGFVRVVLGGALPPGSGASGAAQAEGATTVLATADPAAVPAPGVCVAADATLAAAYGIVTGVAAAELAGVQVLVDGSGWLRAVQPAGSGWDDAGRLAATIRQLQSAPVAPEVGDESARMRM